MSLLPTPLRMHTPWLSILIPVYNVEAYLAECVESVMLQADAGVEVLLLDDCSTDGSATVMHALEQLWPGRLRLLRHAHNQGLSAARNTMIEAAQGEYLWFLDSDDKLLPGAIPSLQAIVKEHHPDIVLCDFQVWRTPLRLKHRLRRRELHRSSFQGPARTCSHDTEELLHGLLLQGQWHAWSKISRRALWTTDLRFPPGKYFEDMAAMSRLALRARSFYHAPIPWVAYRRRNDSILATMNLHRLMDLSSSLGLFHEELQKTPWIHETRIRFALAHQCACNFVGIMRHLTSATLQEVPNPTALAARLRQDYLASAPLSPEELARTYWRHGWWLKRQRFLRFWNIDV